MTPNYVMGYTPASIVFGTDPHILGLGNLEDFRDEEARLLAMSSIRGIGVLREQICYYTNLSQSTTSTL